MLCFVAPSIGLLLSRSLAPAEANALRALMVRMQLVQSDRVTSSDPVPELWLRYLGDQAAQSKWKSRDRQIWWTAYPQDGQPVLVVPGPEGPTLFYADALHEQVDRDAMRQLSEADLRDNPERCLNQLAKTRAVFWRPAALDRMTGQLWPLFFNVGHGCLSWRTRSPHLWMTGVVSNEQLQTSVSSIIAPTQLPFEPLTPSPDADEDTLFDLQLPEAGWLLQGLLGQSLIMQAVEQNYGLESAALDRLLRSPMRLRVHSSDQPSVQASLELDLLLSPADDALLKSSLTDIAQTLRSYGLRRRRVNGSTVWLDDAGSTPRALGGWHQFAQGSWRFSLGEIPRIDQPPPILVDAPMRLRLNPKRLSDLGWLGSTWPKRFQHSSSAEFTLSPLLMGDREPQQQIQFSLNGQLALF